jgi:DNA-binding CsgD family transcriptional regulator
VTDFVSTTHQQPTLTAREHTILALIAEGCPNHEIGTTLFISTDSVKTYNRRMFRKLGAINRENAVAKAFRAGLLR